MTDKGIFKKQYCIPTLWPTYDATVPAEHFDILYEAYGNSTTRKLILPKGTLVYHGSPYEDPVSQLDYSTKTRNKSGIVYFGLDADISLWYLLELYLNDLTSLGGILNIYALKEDISYVYLDEDNNNGIVNKQHPSYQANRHNEFLLHPQYAYQGEPWSHSLATLSLELTIPLDKVTSTLQFVDSYQVNIYLLKMYANTKYDPREAILSKADTLGAMKLLQDYCQSPEFKLTFPRVTTWV